MFYHNVITNTRPGKRDCNLSPTGTTTTQSLSVRPRLGGIQIMQQAQTASNGTVSAFAVNESNESLAAMVTRAVDEWNMIRYYHQLLDFECSETPDSMVLLTNCYRILSEPHREELQLTLTAIHKLIQAKEGS